MSRFRSLTFLGTPFVVPCNMYSLPGIPYRISNQERETSFGCPLHQRLRRDIARTRTSFGFLLDICKLASTSTFSFVRPQARHSRSLFTMNSKKAEIYMRQTNGDESGAEKLLDLLKNPFCMHSILSTSTYLQNPPFRSRLQAADQLPEDRSG